MFHPFPNPYKKYAPYIFLSLGAILIALSCFFFLTLPPKTTNYLSPVPEKIQSAKTPQLPLSPRSPQFIPASVLAASSQKEVLGFLPFWLMDKVDQIPFEKLTQIAYFGLEVAADGSFIKTINDGSEEPGFTHFNSEAFNKVQTKSKENNVKLLLTLRLMEADTIDKFLANSDSKENLITNTVRVLKENELNGINIDFEYVGTPSAATTKSFTKFAKELTEKVHTEVEGSTVSVSAFADSAYKTRLTEIWPLSQVIDHIVIMGYDFCIPSSDIACPLSPLTGSGDKYEYDLTKTLSDYLKLAPPEKIILGLPFYGYDWQVLDDKIYSFALDSAALSSYGRTKKLLAEKGLKPLWDENSQTNYVTYQDEESLFHQIYYDDVPALEKKLNVIKEKNLAGMAIWALGYEGDSPDLWQTISKELPIK